MDDVKDAVTPVNESAIETAVQLLVAPDVASRATVIATVVTSLLPDCACLVHRYLPENEFAPWTILGAAGEISIVEAQHAGNWLFETPESFPAKEQVHDQKHLTREDYAHLNVARTVGALAYLPVEYRETLAGVLEIVVFSGSFEPRQLKVLAPILRLTAPALLSAELFEQQRQTLLDSVHRMSQMYDLEKSLNATLEMDAVIAMVPTKAAAMLPCQAMHLWLFDGANLRLVSSEGSDDTVEPGSTEAPGEGYVADMAEEGEPLLIADENDERLQARNARLSKQSATPPLTNVLLVPLMQDDAEIGVVEAINREDHSFDEDDMFLLSSMAETIANALKNASLMTAERKLEILKVLVQVSSEITSTLRLDRLLQIIVNSPQGVLPYELCAIALDVRGRLQLKAVSGMSSLPIGDLQVERLQQLTRWLSSQDDQLHLRLTEETESVSLPAEVAKHFEETGYRALYSLPLSDDQGRVGLLFYESSDPDFLGVAQIEMIKVLAGQATVALRNALLYREVPLMGILEPLAQRKAALLRTSRGRRTAYAIAAAALLLFLCFCPLPMRVGGEAVIAPQHLVTVTAPVDGNIAAVVVHEGQRVAAGDLLGSLNDWQWRTDLTASEAKFQAAELVMENDLAHGASQAGADRAQTEFLHSEVERARARLESASLRSPIAGVVVTPNLQNMAGQHLDAGAPFAQVLDISSAVVQIAVPEREINLLSAGQSAAIKLDSYPQRTWRAPVLVVSPEATAGDGERTFTVEVPIQNSDATLRAGMTGQAKVFIGWRPAGYVLLRGPALWVWQTLWNWIGW
jgi:transcriptional regulator with GAF, ATPase, and Fis domain/multidrug resistance efflux pump